jgi:SNF2 family DNA or RNA helicase
VKIHLSAKKAGEKRHVVLTCTRAEHFSIQHIVFEDVLNRQARPVRTFRSDGQMVVYRFHMKYLDRLLLTFPFAELSDGLDRRLVRLARAEYEALPVPELDIPGLKGELFDFQKIAVARALAEAHHYLNDEMGLGKTIVALATMLATESYPALVICPNSAKWVWEREVKTWTDLDCVVVNGDRVTRTLQIEKRADVTVINWEALRLHPELADKPYRMVVADEFHRAKNPTSKMTKAFQRIRARRKLLMSGTPMLNRPEELWSPLHYAYPDHWGSNWLFLKRYVITEGQYRKVVGYRHLHEVRDFLREHGTRRRKDHVLRDLPEKVYKTVLVDLTAEQRALYNQIKDELQLALDDGSIRNINGVLPQITRLKQAAFSPELYGGSQHSAKIDELRDLLAELNANHEKAIVFSQWARATRIMLREFEQYNPAYIDGKVKPIDRIAQVDKFQRDEDCRLFIGTIGSCREALTLTAASYVIFTDKGWTPAENEQAAARAHRIGQRNTVTVVEMFANNTIEEKIERLLQTKQRLFDRMIEGDGGARAERFTLRDIRDLLNE